MIRFGLVGLGRIGAIHARNIDAHPRAVLAAVSDPDAARAARVAEKTGCRASGLEELLSDDTIDAVVIASPTVHHAGQAIAAARAGKAVLCEKPLSLDLDSAKACAAAVAACGTPFMIALNKRFDPTVVDLAARLRRGAIGRVELISLIGKDPEPPPDGFIPTSGGLFRDMMIHDIDLALFLAGEPPVEIWATGAVHVSDAFTRANDFDTAAVIMKTRSGVIMTQTLSRRTTFGFDQRIEVHGSEGLLRTGNHPVGHVEQWGRAGIVGPTFEHSFLERYAASYAAELDAFVTCLEEKRPPMLNAAHAVAIQAIADAITDAARSGAPGRVRFET
ncbi:Gfo/Idh/MocA family oxidoreductase [Labrys wisconsinensis]|uniref:Myo-inositol 2-dehydrogenase/D-chiro-inositol 1-dehydrogenase n=1 Tax=Labrys wisconsinensis TaxID=425677 RepID=A0ABU0JB07_9HYPH|nr:Gfo/Idh/MocA family oxidoreductase [Labrys wisconsinensis]MDQ0470608.1 myo-inositol 2-dehydrogenase/D-chiro-inositol 1-dehydrogenase [Labrys wisconsinensis]